MTRRAVVIFNPIAGRGEKTADEELELITSLLENHLLLDVFLTTPERNASTLAARAVSQGVDAVVVCGGDGTISAACAGLVGTDIPVGIIPRGTANAFVKALGLPDTIEGSCRAIVDEQTQIIDTAASNQRPIILFAGVGFQPRVIEKTDREAKNRFGGLAYIVSSVKQLQDLPEFEADIVTPQGHTRVRASAITVANTAPPSSVWAQGPEHLVPDDGLLDITVVAPESKTQAVAASFRLLKSALKKEPAARKHIHYIRAASVRITATPPQLTSFDGELGGNTPLEVACVPASLRLFTPARAPK